MDFIAASDGCKVALPDVSAKIDTLQEQATGVVIFGPVEFNFNIPIRSCDLPGLGRCVLDVGDDADMGPVEGP